ncbi:hypothetical protein L596_020395 [Steinernema carpocapsae]|uniref:Uncharacterized protein n=1 Tax=Steinernema carpocapsae TaxID=34508 RepID=A0A4U5MTH3_STECR|nr:hypothetical protein L596_020395 [Steinernema carpocapsae]
MYGKIVKSASSLFVPGAYEPICEEYDHDVEFYQPRRVVDVSDHKTCALLMTKMKESNRSGSPLSESQLVF